MFVQYCAVLVLYSAIFVNHVLTQTMLNLNRGEICKGSGTTASKCELLKNCPQIGDFRRNRPPICTFQGIDPVICCPPSPVSTGNNNGLVSNGQAEFNCRSYTKENCMILRSEDRSAPLVNNSLGESKVFGGRSAKAKEHKHMALIGYGAGETKSWNCGGTVISERWVLSAAHCANSRGQGPARWARVGDLDISSTTEDARPQEKIITQRIIHPNYKEPAVYNDIALFKLDSSVVFNDWVAPVCLHTKPDIPAKKATVTGWGRLDFVGDVSPQLQEVDITLVNGTECQRLYEESKDSKIPNGIDTNRMVCAGEREGGKDACSGDSGGPLVIQIQSNCLKTQIGITSFGRECGLPNTPGVYTQVSFYVPWIESIVWPST